MQDHHIITLAILAGGQATRMGRAKAELRIDGTPILGWLLDRFDWPGPTLLVTAPGRERPPASERFTREVIDPTSGQGPLRGLLTAIDSATTPLLLVTTLDMPCIRLAHLDWYAQQLAHRPSCIGLMGSHENQVEPFPSIYRLEARDAVAEELVGNRRSVFGLSLRNGFEVVPTPADWRREVWMNLNRDEDLQEMQRAGVGSASF